MSNLVPSSPYSPNPYGPGQRLNRRGQRELASIEGDATVERYADVEHARTIGNRIDLEGALTVHTMQRVVDVIQARHDLAQGDPDIELELLPFQRASFRRMQRHQDNLFNPLG